MAIIAVRRDRTASYNHLPCKYSSSEPCFISSVIIYMGSSTVHTAYNCMSLLCRSFFMIWASAKKSFGSIVPRTRTEIMNYNYVYITFLQRLKLPDLSVLMATEVVLFHSPSHTSPNCPDPNFRTNFSEVLSISHWSRVRCDNPSVTGFSIYIREM